MLFWVIQLISTSNHCWKQRSLNQCISQNVFQLQIKRKKCNVSVYLATSSEENVCSKLSPENRLPIKITATYSMTNPMYRSSIIRQCKEIKCSADELPLCIVSFILGSYRNVWLAIAVLLVTAVIFCWSLYGQ